MENYNEVKNLEITEIQKMEKSNEIVSVGNWVGTIILSAIPIVNIIMLIVWLTSKKIPKSKKNWAIATIIFILIGLLVYVIFALFLLTSVVFLPKT